MTFIGEVPVATRVRIRFDASRTNGGTAVLTAGAGTSQGEQSTTKVIPPAGSDGVIVDCDQEGLLKIEVDFKGASDSGHLKVDRGAPAPDEADITGHTVWRYVVVQSGPAADNDFDVEGDPS